MYKKKRFFRQLSAKREIDRYLESMLYMHQKYELGIDHPKVYKHVDVLGYPKDGEITLWCYNEDGIDEITLPLTKLHEPDNREHGYLLWHNEYYDGPICGLALYNGKKVWYQWKKDVPLSDMRIFNFYEMSDKEVEYEEKWFQFFCDKVTNSCSYIEKAKDDTHYTQESRDYYYKESEKQEDRDYTKNKIVVTLDETFIDRGFPKK